MKKKILAMFIMFATFSDAYPIFPTYYRPLIGLLIIVMIPKVIIALLRSIRKDKYNIEILGLFLIIIFSSLNGLVHFFKYKEMNFDILINLFFIVGGYYTYKILFKKFSLNEIENGIELLGDFLIIVGIIEYLALRNILPYSIKEVLNLILTGNTFSRLKLINMEASWAAMSLSFIVVYFFSKKKYIKTIVSILLVLLTGSTLGIGILFLFFTSYYIFVSDSKIKVIKIISVIIVSASIFYGIILGTKDLKRKPYYISRLHNALKIENISFKKIIKLDNSIFIRVVHPLIGFQIGKDNIFGVGLGNYKKEYPNYIIYFPNYKNNSEVRQRLVDGESDEKNIYSRITAECGYIFLFLYLLILFRIYKKIPNRLVFFKNYFIWILCIHLQFGSYIYMPVIMFLSIYSTKLVKKQKIGVCNENISRFKKNG